MKPKLLYHGSAKKLIGDRLVPKKARDKTNSDNGLNAVYASDYKNEAISMGLHSCRGVKSGSLHLQGINGKIVMDSIIHEGWPNQKYFYLYTLPSDDFEEKPKRSHQWVSFKSIKPIKIEKLLVKDYIHLVRKDSGHKLNK